MSAISELEAHLRHHPDDRNSWLVYADWLTEEGDARGQLVMLEHRLETGALSPEERQGLTEQVQALVRSTSPGGSRATSRSRARS
jgi:uncharacterized protein (TIGR02996 family)